MYIILKVNTCFQISQKTNVKKANRKKLPFQSIQFESFMKVIESNFFLTLF